MALGRGAGYITQGANAIAIGKNAGYENQSSNSIVLNATGIELNGENQGFYVKPIRSTTTTDNVMVYDDVTGEIQFTTSQPGTGTQNQVHLGANSGSFNQGFGALAIGASAGAVNQGAKSVAIGDNTAYQNQGNSAVAIGNFAGQNYQGFGAVSLGISAGNHYQQNSAVAIGNSAGFTGQGSSAVAIGNSAGYQDQPANSIILNATGSALNSTGSGFYVKPIRTGGTANMSYNTSSGEITVASSSRAVKNTIEDLTMGTDALYDLNPKTFIYNSDPGARKLVGYIAEEVADINKHFATYNEADGPPVAINWNTISVFLVEEMKKLKRENEDLMARVLALENK